MRWSILALLLAAPAVGAAQAPPAGSSEPFVVEYYYKTRWGFADEFIRLFKKNHFPVLKREIELGHIQRVTAEAPRFHGTEDPTSRSRNRSCGGYSRTKRRLSARSSDASRSLQRTGTYRLSASI